MTFRHVGITITDVEESLSFYRDVLGFTVARIMNESGKHIDNFSDLIGVDVKTIKLRDENNNMIELLKYNSHPENSNSDKITRIGCSHIALTVKDLDSLLVKIKDLGYSANCDPQYSPDGKVKLTFCKGPDGVLLELVEEL